jgi:metallo-beta-lactamase class B
MRWVCRDPRRREVAALVVALAGEAAGAVLAVAVACGRVAAGAPAGPARETWHADPVKVFDNAYYLGMTEYSVWAITTSQGIILVDAIYDYSIADEVTEGLKKVGLDPAQIKYVIVSHGHLDHAGGAKYLQDTYGAKLIMSAADYDLLDQQNPSWKPKRDMVATDGMQLTLGDTTLTLYLTPGHTLGTISTIIPLRDGTQKHCRRGVGRHALQLRAQRRAAEDVRRISRALPWHCGESRRRCGVLESHGVRRQ